MTYFTKTLFAVGCVAVALTTTQASAQNVDVYFIAGQSNAGNLGEINSYDVQGYNGYNAADFDEQVEAGFTLYFGRIRDRSGFFSNGAPRVGGPVTDFVENFVESELDATNYSVDNIAVQLNAQFGNDIGIFSYGRNGRALANITDESWFPGTVSNPFNDELYGAFQIWSQERLSEIEAGPDGVAGTADDQVATVRGIFWFQGENDADDAGARAAYQTNFENLIARFRADFNNPELAIVASHIRELNSNDASINQSLSAVAASDDFVSVIDISDASVYTPVSANDVHLNAEGFLVIANDFAEQMIALQSGVVVEPEPEPEPQAPGQITISDAEPDTDILLDTIEGTVVSTLINAGAAQGARGEMFQLGEAGESFALSGFTLEANMAATFAAGDTFTIALYTGDPGNAFAPMTSPSTFENVTPEFLDVNSGLTLIHQEDFLGTDATGDAPDGQVGGRDFVTFELSDPVVPGGENITVFVFTNFAFSQFEGNNNGGGRLQLRDDTTTLLNDAGDFGAGTRDLRFLVSGVAGDGPDVLKGDVNMDEMLNFLDISPFILALSSPEGAPAEADCNCDGIVNFLDISPFILKLTTQQ